MTNEEILKKAIKFGVNPITLTTEQFYQLVDDFKDYFTENFYGSFKIYFSEQTYENPYLIINFFDNSINKKKICGVASEDLLEKWVLCQIAKELKIPANEFEKEWQENFRTIIPIQVYRI